MFAVYRELEGSATLAWHAIRRLGVLRLPPVAEELVRQIYFTGASATGGIVLRGLADGSATQLRARSGFQIGVRIVVPPFPYNDPETLENTSKDSVILFKTPSREGFHIEDVRTADGEWLVTGTSGVVLIVCGTGPTMKQAQRQAYNRVKNVMIPHMYYRDDIGERWAEDSDRLHAWGYLREA